MDDPQVRLVSQLALTSAMRRRIFRAVQRLAKRLTDRQLLKEQRSNLTEAEMCNMCYLLPDILMNEPICLELSLDEPIHIIGDIRGQYVHLIHLLDNLGHPPNRRFLFLGNYADNGEKSIETIALLFAYKVLYPNHVYLLRGRHEFASVGRMYGLLDHCLKRFTRRLWSDINTVFQYLPIAAILDDRVFCIHGGLSPVLEFLNVSNVTHLKNEIRQSSGRPALLHQNSILTHLIWSDPDEETVNWEQNPGGMGYLFGPDVVSRFCDQLRLTQIIRSGEVVKNGFEFFKEPRLLTIFSAPDLEEIYANDGATLQLTKLGKDTVRCKIKIMKPLIHLRCKQTTRPNVVFTEFETDLGLRGGPAFIEFPVAGTAEV
ncbi:Serine/threonine-protein phosphatase PP1 isozyme 7 [Clonorchis sinensis]|uniref:Serine/threonine-protein phosphatase PP1 isozyme 7 n=2 Tax=Clonorchis sinensis TaxID=79923 RepID=A0A8T1MLR0_CLOSI|nr:Serine/threonine-protein phosphatase PP1 isozyme 7 [Clonorchis sinensis]GAA30389.1 protein phosphatase 1 catalytic subunit [Clonorchis sinensis]